MSTHTKSTAARIAMKDREISDARKAFNAIPVIEAERNLLLADLQAASTKEVKAALASATVSSVRAVLEDELTRRAYAGEQA